MKRFLAIAGLGAMLCLGACANTAGNVADMNAAYNVAAAIWAPIAANPKTGADTVKQGNALLSSAQAALLAWENAPAGSTAEQTALSSAIAALVSFEAQINQASTHAAADCYWWSPVCPDGVHRG